MNGTAISAIIFLALPLLGLLAVMSGVAGLLVAIASLTLLVLGITLALPMLGA